MNKAQLLSLTIQRLANANSGWGGLLPAEYQQVEYLQCTGEQVIDTGINASSTLLTTATLSFNSSFTYSNLAIIFGCYKQTSQGDTSSAVRYTVSFPSSTQARTSSGTSATNYNIPNVSTGIHTISYSPNTLSVDSTSISINSGTINGVASVYLFGRNNMDYNTPSITYRSTSGLLIYNAKLGTSTDAAQYRDLYPCYRKLDNVTGMYDLVNSEFIPYSGTANFITGNNV